MIKVIVFDLDDTLISEYDYVKSGFHSLSQFLQKPKFYDVSMELFHAGQRGNVFNLALDQLNISYDSFFIKKLVHHYRSHIPKISLLPGAQTVLKQLTNNYKLALITDGHQLSQKAKIQALNLSKLFEYILVTDELGEDRQFWKPHEKSYSLVEQHFSVSASSCLYIGDNIKKDFITPNKRGWKTIQIKHPNREYQQQNSVDKEYLAQYEIDDFEAVIKIIKGII